MFFFNPFRFKYPDPEEEFDEEEARPAPFHFQLKTPQPSSFNKRPKFPQLTQYRYPHSSRNIQDIIKYLTNDPNAPNRGIKFTGVYVNPKKYDMFPEVGELMANSDRNEYQSDVEQDETEDEDEPEEEEMSESSRYGIGNNVDPFYQYKPKHPADVNLLAPANVRSVRPDCSFIFFFFFNHKCQFLKYSKFSIFYNFTDSANFTILTIFIILPFLPFLLL